MAVQLNKHLIIDMNEAYQKTLLWFFSFPDKITTLSELADAVSASKKTANTVVQKLAKEGFLKKEVFGGTWKISCNREHIYNISRKVPNNIMSVLELNVVPAARSRYPNARAIILFGSYRKGDDTEKSDIDIAVELIGNKKQEIVNIGEVDFEYRKRVKVNLLVFSRKNIDINLFSNIANGFVLDGFMEVNP